MSAHSHSHSHSISIIIPSLNSPLIDQVVQAVLAQSVAPLEVIVVGRDELSKLKSQPAVRFIDTQHPISPAKARNLGAQQAHGDILCFIDADAIADPHWLAALWSAHQHGADVAGGSVALPSGTYWFTCDNIAAFADFLSSAPSGTRPYLPSINLSLKRTLFNQMNGFDERFPGAASEDTDLCFRLRKAGHALVFEPKASVTHYSSRRTLAQMWAHLRQYGREFILLQRLHQDLIGPSLRVKLAQRSALLGALIAPGWGALEALQWLRQGRISLALLPGIFLARTAYHVGLASRAKANQKSDFSREG